MVMELPRKPWGGFQSRSLCGRAGRSSGASEDSPGKWIKQSEPFYSPILGKIWDQFTVSFLVNRDLYGFF
jgi:hypothetical protein